jgi:hypothetical protein
MEAAERFRPGRRERGHTLFAALFPTEVRYTGMSFVYQVSGIYASGITPLLMTTFLALGQAHPGSGGHLALTAVVSLLATWRIRSSDMHFAAGTARRAESAPRAPRTVSTGATR